MTSIDDLLSHFDVRKQSAALIAQDEPMEIEPDDNKENRGHKVVNNCSPSTNSDSVLKTTCAAGDNLKLFELKSIFKKHSSFPKEPCAFPKRLLEYGKLRDYTRDKNGRVVPLLSTFYFKNLKYEANAKDAIEKHKVFRHHKRLMCKPQLSSLVDGREMCKKL
jgi:hypothetical protein